MTYFRLLSLLSIVLFQFSCASISPVVSDSEQLSLRAHSRWLALIEKKWEKAYLFETKGYRDSHTVEQYKMGFGRAVIWKDTEIYKVDLNELANYALVTIRLTVKMILPGMGEEEADSVFKEDWLKDNGEWWHYKKK